MCKESLTIKDMPLEERPYEKLEQNGVTSLSDAELLAIMIGSGDKKKTALEIARQMVELAAGEGLSYISEMSLEEFQLFQGIGRAKAIRLKAAFALGNRAYRGRKYQQKTKITAPQHVFRLMEAELCHLKREVFYVLLLDTRNRLIRKVKISEGTLNKAVVQPRDIFHEALKANALSIIMIHNHPSGDSTPSTEDIMMTKHLIKAGQMLGIKILDHMIIAAETSSSMKMLGLVEFE